MIAWIMEVTWHPVPEPPQLGTRDGLAYALFLPDGPASAGVLILHGADSAKESHFEFARAARARGIAALAYDARGHGRSAGEFGPTAFGDALAMLDLLREHARAVAVRGSSMGGFEALHVAALEPEVAAVVAICPAPEDVLLRLVRSGDEELEWRIDRQALEPWLSSLSVYEAVRRLSPDTDLLLMHAQGDAQVPWTVSEELHARARSERKRLLVLPGGHHRSVQHDGELHGESLRFIERAVARRAS
jgi:alpha-beta hydrolase superfamily lysophospholipase